MLFNPIVYHKVLAASFGNPPLLLLGVSQFLRALLFSAGLGGDEIFNPAESLQKKSAFNYCSLLRAEVKEQVELVHGSHLSSFRAADISDEAEQRWRGGTIAYETVLAMNHVKVLIRFVR